MMEQVEDPAGVGVGHSAGEVHFRAHAFERLAPGEPRGQELHCNPGFELEVADFTDQAHAAAAQHAHDLEPLRQYRAGDRFGSRLEQ